MSLSSDRRVKRGLGVRMASRRVFTSGSSSRSAKPPMIARRPPIRAQGSPRSGLRPPPRAGQGDPRGRTLPRMPEAWIIDGVRSPRGRGKDTGSLHDIHPQELLAQVLNALVDRVGVDRGDGGRRHHRQRQQRRRPRQRDRSHGGARRRLARHHAGLHRSTGSAARASRPSTWRRWRWPRRPQDLVVGGGVESMSRRPAGERAADFTAGNEHLRAMHPLVPQGISADLIATVEGFAREDCDTFAVESQTAHRGRAGRGPLRPQPGRRSITPTARSRSTTTSTRAPDPRSRRWPRSSASFAKHGRGDAKPASTSRSTTCARRVYPDVDRGPPRASRRQLVRRRRRRRRACSSRRRTTRRRNGLHAARPDHR